MQPLQSRIKNTFTGRPEKDFTIDTIVDLDHVRRIGDDSFAFRQIHHVKLLPINVARFFDIEGVTGLLLEGVHEEHLVLAPFPFRVELLAVGGRVLAHAVCVLIFRWGWCGLLVAGALVAVVCVGDWRVLRIVRGGGARRLPSFGLAFEMLALTRTAPWALAFLPGLPHTSPPSASHGDREAFSFDHPSSGGRRAQRASPRHRAGAPGGKGQPKGSRTPRATAAAFPRCPKHQPRARAGSNTMSNIVQALRKGYLGAGRCDTDGRREADLEDVAWDRSRSTMTRTPGTATKRMWDPPPPPKPQPAFTPPAGAQTLLNECEKAQDAVGLKDALKVLLRARGQMSRARGCHN